MVPLRAMTAHVRYLGNLQTICTHASGEVIQTDAPIDNHGEGRYFSPTDLMATSLASCFLTIVGIYCREHGISFHGAAIDVTKIMASNPRRIAEIKLTIDLSENHWDAATQKKVIAAGKACPVAATLKDQVKIDYQFA